MNTIFSFLVGLLSNEYFTLLVRLSSILFQCALLLILFFYGTNNKIISKATVFLMIVLFGSLLVDLHWILVITGNFAIGGTPNYFVTLSRITWAMQIAHYSSMNLFISKLIPLKSRLTNLPSNIISISGFFLCGFFLIAAFFPNYLLKSISMKISYVFMLMVVAQLMSWLIAALRNPKIPKLLKRQIKICVAAFLAQYFSFDFLMTVVNFSKLKIETYYTDPFATFSNIILMIALYICVRRLAGVRFLNIRKNVVETHKPKFIIDCKEALEAFTNLKHSGIDESKYKIKRFFMNAFSIPSSKLHLMIREKYNCEWFEKEKKVAIENFLKNPHSEEIRYLSQSKVLVKDDIEFSLLYEDKPEYSRSLELLDFLEADLFLPIYGGDKEIIAYVIIEKDARPHKLYEGGELDEMVIFAMYLGSALDLMRFHYFDDIISESKNLKETIFDQHQRLKKYEESINSLMSNSNDREIGIAYFKDEQINFVNKEAEELLCSQRKITSKNCYPTVNALGKLIEDVKKYRSRQSTTVHVNPKKSVDLSAIPVADKNIIAISVVSIHPIDKLKAKFSSSWLHSRREKLLFLETTAEGRLINKLIPGSSKKLTDLKINLLKVVLTRRAALLSGSNDDIKLFVEILHNTSFREILCKEKLNAPEKNLEIGMKLFGIKPLFLSPENKIDKSLLLKLNKVGTLFLENVQYLDLRTQKHLAEFLRTGLFRAFHSKNQIHVDVRVICSTDSDLHKLVERGQFSQALLDELEKTSTKIPRPRNLSEEDFENLSKEISMQEFENSDLQNFCGLSKKDVSGLETKKLTSINKLRQKIREVLLGKSNNTEPELEKDSKSVIDKHDEKEILSYAIKLGREALKDQKIMTFLWKKFKNQTKIAKSLGVNRTTVHRACKKYNLI